MTKEMLACTICLEPQPKEVGVLNCKHSYCFECIKGWSDRENTCPLCKVRFTSITRIRKSGPIKGRSKKVRVKRKDQRSETHDAPIWSGLDEAQTIDAAILTGIGSFFGNVFNPAANVSLAIPDSLVRHPTINYAEPIVIDDDDDILYQTTSSSSITNYIDLTKEPDEPVPIVQTSNPGSRANRGRSNGYPTGSSANSSLSRTSVNLIDFSSDCWVYDSDDDCNCDPGYDSFNNTGSDMSHINCSSTPDYDWKDCNRFGGINWMGTEMSTAIVDGLLATGSNARSTNGSSSSSSSSSNNTSSSSSSSREVDGSVPSHAVYNSTNQSVLAATSSELSQRLKKRKRVSRGLPRAVKPADSYDNSCRTSDSDQQPSNSTSATPPAIASAIAVSPNELAAGPTEAENQQIL